MCWLGLGGGAVLFLTSGAARGRFGGRGKKRKQSEQAERASERAKEGKLLSNRIQSVLSFLLVSRQLETNFISCVHHEMYHKNDEILVKPENKSPQR